MLVFSTILLLRYVNELGLAVAIEVLLLVNGWYYIYIHGCNSSLLLLKIVKFIDVLFFLEQNYSDSLG
jgi:hypothetical protein